MAIWLLQPDLNGQCCSCQPVVCAPCSAGCIPITLNQAEINQGFFIIQTTPTGTVLKLGGANASILFTNANSRITAISNAGDFIEVQGEKPNGIFGPTNPNTRGFPNQVVPYEFEFQLQINSGEIVTLYAETSSSASIPTSQYYPNFPINNPPVWPFSFGFGVNTTIDLTPPFCTNTVPQTPNTKGTIIYSSGGGGGSANAGTSTFSANNTSGQTLFTALQPGLSTPAFTGANASNPNSVSSSLTYSQITSFGVINNCPPFTCAFATNVPYPSAGNPFQMCYNSASYATVINENVLYGSSVISLGVGTESYQYNNGLVGCAINGSSAANCQSAPGAMNQSITFQVGPIKKFINTGFAPVNFLCAVVTLNNNGYISLTGPTGAPVNLMDRLISIDVQGHSLP